MPSLTTRAQVSLQGGTLQTYFDICMLQSEILVMRTLYFMSKHVYINTEHYMYPVCWFCLFVCFLPHTKCGMLLLCVSIPQSKPYVCTFVTVLEIKKQKLLSSATPGLF